MATYNRYIIREKLGQGGMGAVFRATDRLTGQDIALKQVLIGREQLTSNSSQTFDAELNLALAFEFQTLATLQHPNIIPVQDYGFDETEQPFFTMKLLEDGRNIRVAADGLPDLNAKVNLLIQLLRALTYLHHRGIVHRDLKPNNVMVQHGQVFVLDFGLAIQRSTTQQRGGSLAYMAPEVLLLGQSVFASDQYAVGVIAYELLTGQYPYEKKNLAMMTQNILTVTPDLSPIPNPQLAAVIGQLLEKKPENRFPDAQAAIRAFSQAINQPILAKDTAIHESFLQAAAFVARDDELATLITALKNVEAGQPSAWLVGGESGVGKSRLLNELRIRALVNAIPVIHGQAIAEAELPYQLWLDVLRSLCLQTQISDFEAGVLKPLIPDISSLLGRTIPNLPSADPQAGKSRLLQVIEAVFTRQHKPILLLLEDLHWMDRESQQLLEWLLQNVTQSPLLIVASYRNDETPHLQASLPQMQSLLLNRLKKEQIIDLSIATLGEQIGQQNHIVELLEHQTEGNVYFIIEVLRTLSEMATELADIGNLTLPQHLFAEGMKTIFERRLNKLSPAALEALAVAAVAGRQLDLVMLKATLQSIANFDLDTWINDGANNAIFERIDLHWRFVHDKLREYVLSGISPSHKIAIHEKIALALETVYPDNRQHAAQLFYHWHQAANPAKEAYYARLAGQQALSLSAYQDAVDLLQQAITLHTDSNTLATLEADLTNAYYGLNELHQCTDHANQALLHLNLPIIPQSPRQQIAMIVWAILEQLLYIFLPIQPPRVQGERYTAYQHATNIYILAAVAYLFNKHTTATLLCVLRCINCGERTGDSYSMAYGYGGIAYALLPYRLNRVANYYMQRAIQLLEESPAEVTPARARAYHVISTSLVSIGAIPAANRYNDYTEQLLKQVGDDRRRMDILSNQSLLATLQSHYDLAHHQRLEVYEYGQKNKDIRIQNWGVAGMGIVALYQGDLAAVQTHWEQRNSLVQQMRQQGLTNISLAPYQLVLEWHLGQVSPLTVQQALGELRQVGYAQAHDCFAYFFCAEALLGLCEQDLNSYPAEAKEVIVRCRRFRKTFPLAQSRLLVWEGLYEQLYGSAKKAQQLWQQALQTAQSRQMPYDEALAYFYTGVYNSDSALIQKATAIFEQIGAKWADRRAIEHPERLQNTL